jgi:nucleotide-binding universal stress UspA family protein
MTCLPTSYGILVGVDGSVTSDAAIRFATREAVLLEAPLTLMHVLSPIPDWGAPSMHPEVTAAWEDNARHIVEQAREATVVTSGESALLDVRTEIAYSTAATAASVLIGASSQAQMIVVGCRGMGTVGRLVLGSVSSALVQHACCPVAVIHDDDGLANDKAPVLVGVDGSLASEAAVALAFDEASRRRVRLVALHAWSDVGVFPILGMDWRDYETRGAQLLAKSLAGEQARFPDVQVQRRLVCDKPAHWLIEESQQAQLVVVGSHGRGRLPGIRLGSVSSALAHSTRTPLIIHRTGDVNE